MCRSLLILTICLVLAGCNMPGQQTTAVPQVWFDMPLPESVLMSADLCQVVAHGAAPNGIALFELSTNGAAISIPESGPLVTLNHGCGLLQPGRNLLELRVQDKSGTWSEYAETTVILAGAFDSREPAATGTIPPLATGTIASTFTAIPTPTETLTPVPMPTSTLTPQPAGEVTIQQISSNVVYLGSPNCGPIEVFITAHAVAPDEITAVVLFYRFRTNDFSTDFQSLAMNPLDGELYEGTLNPTFLLGGLIPFDQAILEYQVVIQETDGDTSLRTPVLADIEARACGSSSGGTDACSAFVDQRACVANNCNWWEIPGTPPTFVCKSKP